MSGMRKAWLVGVTATLVAAGGLVMQSSAAVTLGPWTIDGVVDDAAAAGIITGPHLSDPELGPVNGKSTKLAPINRATPPMLGYTNPNSQVDVNTLWVANQEQAGKQWLYLGFQRDAANGSGVLIWEFGHAAPPAACDYAAINGSDATARQYQIDHCNPWANRQAGDVLLIFDQNGSAGLQIWMRTFTGSAGFGQDLTLGPIEALDATVAAAASSADGLFGEAAIDINSVLFGDQPGCHTFNNILPSTVTGNSDTADFKDTAFFPVTPLSTCGTLVVKKVVNNTHGMTGIASDFSVTVTGVSGSKTFVADASDSKKGTITIPNLEPGEYTVTENTPPVGYTPSYDGCKPATVTLSQPGLCTITNNDSAASPGGTTSMSWVLKDAMVLSDLRPGAPTGAKTIVFRLYSDELCSALVGTDTVTAVTSAATYTTPIGIAVASVGTYYWTAQYSGDAYNNGFTTRCGYEVTTVAETVTPPVLPTP